MFSSKCIDNVTFSVSCSLSHLSLYQYDSIHNIVTFNNVLFPSTSITITVISNKRIRRPRYISSIKTEMLQRILNVYLIYSCFRLLLSFIFLFLFFFFGEASIDNRTEGGLHIILMACEK